MPVRLFAYYRDRIKRPKYRKKRDLNAVKITVFTLNSCVFSDILFCPGATSSSSVYNLPVWSTNVIAVQYVAVQYVTVQYVTVQYVTVQHVTVQYVSRHHLYVLTSLRVVTVPHLTIHHTSSPYPICSTYTVSTVYTVQPSRPDFSMGLPISVPRDTICSAPTPTPAPTTATKVKLNCVISISLKHTYWNHCYDVFVVLCCCIMLGATSTNFEIMANKEID